MLKHHVTLSAIQMVAMLCECGPRMAFLGWPWLLLCAVEGGGQAGRGAHRPTEVLVGSAIPPWIPSHLSLHSLQLLPPRRCLLTIPHP